MLERIVLILALAAVVVIAVVAARRWNARNVMGLKRSAPAWESLGAQPDGRRTVVAFSTPSCAACHKAQAPAIDLARKHLGENAVRLIKVDAAAQPETARAFGILTVPSTVVIAADGDQVVAVNQGFTPSGRLVQQLQQA